MKKGRLFFRKPYLVLLSVALFFISGAMAAQQSAAPASRSIPSLTQSGVYLIFPFENAGASPRLDWIGEGLEELTIQKLSAAGLQVYSRDSRLDEMDRDGFPANAKLSRATMLHIAQEMDADFVVFGNFGSDGSKLTVNARVLRVNPVALLPAVREIGPLESLMDLHTRLAWRLLSSMDRALPLSLAEFTKLQRPLQLGALEHYTRGLLANDDDARIRDLKEAARLEPDWPDPAFALGEVYFNRNDCGSALNWFARVPPTHKRSVEAVFGSGVCLLRINQPEKAEKVFSSLQDDLKRNMATGAELPEILNNLGLARARQGKVDEALTPLGRARDLDPDEDDYPFNLGLLALQSKNYATAATDFQDAMQREPDNPEDRAFLIYSLAERDSAAVHVTLARIYLERKQPDLARAEVEKAVKIAPNYSEARQLLDHLQNSKPTGGAQ